MTLLHEDLGDTWRKARPRPAGRHLDSAASSRQSHRALEAAAHHARHEAELGGYVAAAAAENLLQQGRSLIGGLVGMAAADVAFGSTTPGSLGDGPDSRSHASNTVEYDPSPSLSPK